MNWTQTDTLKGIREAAEAAARRQQNGVVFCIARKRPPEAEHVRLCSSFGPFGVVLNAVLEKGSWRIVATFQTAAVLEFCRRYAEPTKPAEATEPRRQRALF